MYVKTNLLTQLFNWGRSLSFKNEVVKDMAINEKLLYENREN